MTDRWTIRITYRTGDSNGSHDAVAELGASWPSLEQAKKALAVIRERVIAREFESDWADEKYLLKKYGLTKPPKPVEKQWSYVNDRDYYMRLPGETEGSEPLLTHTFWEGYFESFNSATIVSANPKDNSMSFST